MAVELRTSPSQSLYLQNLPIKMNKNDLRRELYMLFSTYGPILDITAMRSKKMLGQAHVLFRDMHAATSAMRECQNFDFFGREMRIAYAKSTSKTLSKLSGVFEKEEEEAAAENKPANSFVALPGSVPGAGVPSSLPAPPKGFPTAPPQANGANLTAPTTSINDAPSPQGVKRPREESDNEEAPMDEGSDEEAEMDMSDDD